MRLEKDPVPILRQLGLALREAGFDSEAEKYDQLLSTGWTTSSEFLGEIMLTLRAIPDEALRKIGDQRKREALDLLKDIECLFHKLSGG